MEVLLFSASAGSYFGYDIFGRRLVDESFDVSGGWHMYITFCPEVCFDSQIEMFYDSYLR